MRIQSLTKLFWYTSTSAQPDPWKKIIQHVVENCLVQSNNETKILTSQSEPELNQKIYSRSKFSNKHCDLNLRKNSGSL